MQIKSSSVARLIDNFAAYYNYLNLKLAYKKWCRVKPQFKRARGFFQKVPYIEDLP